MLPITDEILIVPFDPPLQDGCALVVFTAIPAPDWETVAVVEAEHQIASVTVTE